MWRRLNQLNRALPTTKQVLNALDKADLSVVLKVVQQADKLEMGTFRHSLADFNFGTFTNSSSRGMAKTVFGSQLRSSAYARRKRRS